MPKGKKRGGGPNTPQGKANSSKNSTKHGVLSKAMILKDETQEQYDAVARGWHQQWEPADYQEQKLVDTLIMNDWQHQRAQRRLFETEAAIAVESGLNPADWTAEQRHRLELMQRYKTSAERAFYKSWSVLQGLKKDIMRVEKETAKLRAERARLRIQAGLDPGELSGELPGESPAQPIQTDSRGSECVIFDRHRLYTKFDAHQRYRPSPRVQHTGAP